jgi:RNA polymerase sigma factor for flagellar operon FliA
MKETQRKLDRNRRRAAFDERVVAEHMPLVRRLARRVAVRAPASIAFDDLVSAGTIGLVESVARNRGGDGGASFACYLHTRIRGAIYDELRASDWLPRRARSRANAEVESGPPRPVAVIRFDDLPQGAATALSTKDADVDPVERLTEKRVRSSLHRALAGLSERDRLVIHLRYFKGMQVREIGRLLGVSEARVSQIHHRALDRIRPLVEIAA